MGKRHGRQREAAADGDDNKQRRRAARQQRQPEMPATRRGAEEAVPGLRTANREHSEQAPAQDGHDCRRQRQADGKPDEHGESQRRAEPSEDMKRCGQQGDGAARDSQAGNGDDGRVDAQSGAGSLFPVESAAQLIPKC